MDFTDPNPFVTKHDGLGPARLCPAQFPALVSRVVWSVDRVGLLITLWTAINSVAKVSTPAGGGPTVHALEWARLASACFQLHGAAQRFRHRSDRQVSPGGSRSSISGDTRQVFLFLFFCLCLQLWRLSQTVDALRFDNWISSHGHGCFPSRAWRGRRPSGGWRIKVRAGAMDLAWTADHTCGTAAGGWCWTLLRRR